MVENKLSHNWILVARIGWFCVTLFLLTLFTLGLPHRHRQLATPCDASFCPILSLSSTDAALIDATGFSLQGYASFHIGLEVFVALIMSAAATLIFWKYFDNLMGVLTAYLLAYIGLSGFVQSAYAFAVQYPPVESVYNLLFALFPVLILLLIFTFPNGRFLNNLSGAAFVIILLIIITDGIISADFIPDTGHPVTTAMFIGALAIGIWSQIHRYRNFSTIIEKQQTKWVLLGFAGLVLCMGGWSLFFEILPPSTPQGLLLTNTLGLAAIYLLACIFPISLMNAIIRYRLWNIDIIINRTLVYGGLTLLIVTVYTLVVGGFGLIFQSSSGNLAISLFATALVAILFQPAREQIQHTINELMFGESNNPYVVLSTLGEQIQTTAVPSETLNSLVETLVKTLKLPYAAIELIEENRRIRQAAVGQPLGKTAELPLRYQNETVGFLIVSPRSAGEQFSEQEQRLLETIAAQIGPVASATRLTTALQHARERLVLTREEERRRIRRDLHDGLGPTMASQMLQMEAVLDLLLNDPQLAAKQVEQLMGQTQQMVTDIRRLVHELYPSALDELGLTEALRAHIGQMQTASRRLSITIQAEQEPLPLLPAAIEVAAYRIATEAVTNTIRHAHASHCTVLLAAKGGSLYLTICDDGIGLQTNYQPGIGLGSMQERAEELGGSWKIASIPSGGTQITAVLPYERR